jgi:hypothetical protein
MTAAVDRIEDPREVSGQRAGDLDVETGRFVLAGVQLGVGGPRPAEQQGAVDDALGVRVQVLSHRTYRASAVPSSGVKAVTARLIVD